MHEQDEQSKLKKNSMVEVFITNIRTTDQAGNILRQLKHSFPGLEINFDLSGSDAAFPCGHSILRTEGSSIDPENIIATVNRSGFKCDVLEDKRCN